MSDMLDAIEINTSTRPTPEEPAPTPDRSTSPLSL